MIDSTKSESNRISITYDILQPQVTSVLSFGIEQFKRERPDVECDLKLTLLLVWDSNQEIKPNWWQEGQV